MHVCTLCDWLRSHPRELAWQFDSWIDAPGRWNGWRISTTRLAESLRLAGISTETIKRHRDESSSHRWWTICLLSIVGGNAYRGRTRGRRGER